MIGTSLLGPMISGLFKEQISWLQILGSARVKESELLSVLDETRSNLAETISRALKFEGGRFLMRAYELANRLSEAATKLFDVIHRGDRTACGELLPLARDHDVFDRIG
jgi:hypothetical protein